MNWQYISALPPCVPSSIPSAPQNSLAANLRNKSQENQKKTDKKSYFSNISSAIKTNFSYPSHGGEKAKKARKCKRPAKDFS